MENVKKDLFGKVIDFILVVFFILLAVKKCGFYKTDSILCELGILVLYVIYAVHSLIKKHNIKNGGEGSKKEQVIDIIQILLLFFSLSYLLPILTNNYSSLTSSIDYFIRYFCLFAIYGIVKNSKSKKIFIVSLLVISLFECILGVDQIACRFFEDTLKNVNSSYISDINLDRMSGTIQYANVFAIICAMSSIITFNKIVNLKKQLNNKKEYITLVALNLLFFIYTSSVMLSGSRAVIILFLVSVFIIVFDYFRKKMGNGKYIFTFLITQFFYIIAYCTLIAKFQKINELYIYYITLISYIVVAFSSLLICIICNKVKKCYNVKLKEFDKNKKIRKIFILLIIFCFIIIIYLVLNLKVKIRLYSDAAINSVSRNIYNLNKGEENNIHIKIKPNVEDTRYEISILAVDTNFDSSVIANYSYYSRTDDTFDVTYVPDNNFNYLIVYISCSKGNLDIEDILVNNKENYIDYLLLPSDVVYRINESFKLNLSIKDRYFFYKDAIKISTSSVKNILFGIGGGGYEDASLKYRTGIYSSSQVHSSILQILVESGIIGVGLYMSIIIVTIKKGNNNIYKFLFIIYFIHSLIDINYSYFYCICLLGIIIGVIYNDKFCIRINSKILKNIFEVMPLFITFALIILLFGQNFAYYYKIVKYDESITLHNCKKIVKQHENIVRLDPFENRYRERLNEAYIKYLDLLEKNNGDDENLHESNDDYINTISRVNDNILFMRIIQKYDIDIMIEESDVMIKYLDELVHLNYKENLEKGYEYYLSCVYNNVNYVDKLEYNDYAKGICENACSRYITCLKEEYIRSKNEILMKYINMFNCII